MNTGEFMEYFGKSLSADEMDKKMGALIRDWERERFLREVRESVAILGR